MKIAQTDYYLRATEFLRKPPEAAFATFSDVGLTYINGELDVAVALYRASKSNYDVTIIAGGEIWTVTEHNIESAAQRVRQIIQNARS